MTTRESSEEMENENLPKRRIRHLRIPHTRVPKACSECRGAKVRCDGNRPCTRCARLLKECVYVEPPKDPVKEIPRRLEVLEEEVAHLHAELERTNRSLQALLKAGQVTGFESELPSAAYVADPRQIPPPLDIGQGQNTSGEHYSQLSSSPSSAIVESEHSTNAARGQNGSPLHSRDRMSLSFLSSLDESNAAKRKRKAAEFELRDEKILDFITQGLITLEQAASFFDSFFKGCDRYIPIFDPGCDTFVSIRGRSSLLLNAICAIGCRVENQPGSRTAHLLRSELNKWISVIILERNEQRLETVQALLVVACYSVERSTILSLAIRMALDLALPKAYEDLTKRLVVKSNHSGTEPNPDLRSDERQLMRRSRTWFGVLVLEHIFHVDAGKIPSIRSTGDGKRSRLMLNSLSATALDLRLLAQVELNFFRAKTNDAIDMEVGQNGSDIAEFVYEVMADLDVWLSDWTRMVEAFPAIGTEKPYLLINLQIQRCWAEMMVHCRSLRVAGIENVAVMSPAERKILVLAENCARRHLKIIVSDPEHYLLCFKYAMDFVWAKCAFCFLLLLKLTRLLPVDDNDNLRLLEDGHVLLRELSKSAPNEPSSSANMYIQILSTSIEKYGRVLAEHQANQRGTEEEVTTMFWKSFDAQIDLQSFVPEQFVSDWDFPMLNLFYFPTSWTDFFSDFGAGASHATQNFNAQDGAITG